MNNTNEFRNDPFQTNVLEVKCNIPTKKYIFSSIMNPLKSKLELFSKHNRYYSFTEFCDTSVCWDDFIILVDAISRDFSLSDQDIKNVSIKVNSSLDILYNNNDVLLLEPYMIQQTLYIKKSITTVHHLISIVDEFYPYYPQIFPISYLEFSKPLELL